MHAQLFVPPAELFRRVLAAPILFFLRTPVGDVLNAFARDQVRGCLCANTPDSQCKPLLRSVTAGCLLSALCLAAWLSAQDTLDETLPDTLHMTGIYLMILLTSLAIVTVSIYYYAIMTGALFLAFAMMQYLYLPAATLLKRWAGDTASSLFVHVDESLQGMDVIRAFGAVNYFIQVCSGCARPVPVAHDHKGAAPHPEGGQATCCRPLLSCSCCCCCCAPQENVNLLNRHHLALFNMEQTNLWLAFWCDFLGAVLVVATCLFSVAFSETLGAPNVGLAISNSIQVLVFFTWVVRGVADTVSMWDAIERVTSFATQVGWRSRLLERNGKLVGRKTDWCL